MSQKPNYFIEGDWTRPEFQYLKDNFWVGTEKIDGMNIRVIYRTVANNGIEINDADKVSFRGKTDNANMPPLLLEVLNKMFPVEKFKKMFGMQDVTLYGEGYGAGIQKGGNYIRDGQSFILFDILINDWWLERGNMVDIATKLGIDIVQILSIGTIDDAIMTVKRGLKSSFGDFLAEGLVLKPLVELKARSGKRIVTKLKHKDFRR